MVEWFKRYWMDTIQHTEKISLGHTFTDIINLCCDLDLEYSNPIFSQNTLAYDAVLSNQVRLQTNQQFRRCKGNSHILCYISPRCDLDIKNSEPPFFCMRHRLMIIHQHTKFG